MNEYNQEQIATEIAELLNSDRFLDALIGKTGGAQSGGSLVVKSNGRQISAIAVGEVPPGDCVALKDTKTGQWYAVSSYGEGKSNEYLIRYRRWRQPEDDVVSIITLIQSDWNTDYNSNPKPSGHKDVEYWLTGGGKYSLKRIVTKPLTLGFNNSEARLSFDGSEAFLQNAGNGKYLAATRSHELPPINYGGASNRTYQRNIFTIQKEDKSTVKIISDFYGNFTYLGNGIYQSFIEDGIGRIFNEVPKYLEIPGAIMRSVPIGGGYYYDGIRKGIDDNNNPLRLDANILPETSNFVIYNGELHQLSGSLSVELNNIFDYIFVDDYYQYNQANNTDYRPETYLPEENPLFPYRVAIYLASVGNQFKENVIKDRTFAWRNKTIQHQVWLPTGNSTFNYSSEKTKVRNNLPGNENSPRYVDLYNYTFNETMSGEVLLMSWKSKYITSTFTIAKESKDWITQQDVNYYPWSINIFTKTQEITSKTEILTLKTYGDAEGEKNLVLNSNGKWLVLFKRPKQLNSDANLTVTKDTTHFRIKREIGYLGIVPVDYTPDYDLSSYVNENVITSFMIGNSAYIARGKITAIDFEIYSPNNNNIYNGRDWFTIEITQFKLIPKVETKADLNDFDYREYLLPFPWRIVLDNGCFWNYYLSYETTSVDIESLVTSYPYFQGGNVYSQLRRIRLGSATLLCDQFVKYIHTNPITVPFCSSVYYPPSILLIQDNLVGNSIYRVNDDILLQAYIERATNEWLGITKMPVSEWKISNNGDIKYNKTFLVDYRLKRPYYDRETDESLSFNVIPVTHSYHP